MDLKKYQSGAVGSPPTAPTTPSDGYPVSAVPGVNPATKPGPYWYYQMQAEFHAVLAAAGITPSHTSLAQLLAAINALDGRPGHTYTSSDWAWLSKQGGLIVQWGTATSAPIDNAAITFPTAFPAAVFGVYLAMQLPDSAPANGVGVSASPSLSGFTYYNTNLVGSVTSFWVAIGR